VVEEVRCCLSQKEKIDEQNNNEVWDRQLAVLAPSLFVRRRPDREDARDDCVGDAEQELKPHRPLVELGHGFGFSTKIGAGGCMGAAISRIAPEIVDCGKPRKRSVCPQVSNTLIGTL
jgi:hypothetical protein